MCTNPKCSTEVNLNLYFICTAIKANMRSVFLAILLLYTGYCTAQYPDIGIVDLFIQEGLVKFNLHNSTFKGIREGMYDESDKERFARYGVEEVQYNHNQSIYTTTLLKDLSRYNAGYADSIIELLKSGNTENIHHFTDPLYASGVSADIEAFLSLQKRMIGNLIQLDQPLKQAIFIKARKHTYIKISGMALFAKAAGKLILFFSVSDKNELALAKLDFIPLTNQQNVFVKAIAENDIKNIQDKNFNAFEQNFSPWFARQIARQRKRFEKDLGSYQITDSLYDFRLFYSEGYIELRGVYYTQNTDDKIEISYTLAVKKFLVDLVKKAQYTEQPKSNYKPIELTPGPEKP